MDKIAIIISLTCVVSAARAQPGSWMLLPESPSGATNGRHEDISFPTPDVGFVVNFDGEIHRTTDGGASWELIQSVQTVTEGSVRLRSVGFADENRGWIGSLTPGYTLWQTKDGGQSLENLDAKLGGGDDLGICGIWVVNENVVYAVGRYYSPARLYMTKDGGITWTVKTMDQYAQRLVDVFFFDELNGFAVGGDSAGVLNTHAVVLRTHDGGETWEVKHTSNRTREWAWKISFPTPNVGYVSVERQLGGNARVLKTSDGGETWTESVIDGSRPLQGIGFATPLLGWASGRGTTTRTLDGGRTWQVDETDLDDMINRFRFFGDTLGYAVGKRIYKYLGKAQVDTEPAEIPIAGNRLGRNYPNPFYPYTTFEYEIGTTNHVFIAVYDLLGRNIATLVDRRQAAGAHRVMWDGRTSSGESAAPGFYLYAIRTPEYVETRRMILLGPP